ncbi:retron-type reverse transcriptase [Leifsonia sp. AK011]|uniref:reverse transcriptase domain-containing protein n=1 Tax=Leifsonia sp. AK011 TaxID=2723075 RepID=UPI0015CE0B23|nr:reverse transcriptase domain-containing protein [Leifsonia sp. AK011]NYF09354.1 retron-type reverse transcriptase [Leifsonia sp. AK011]
MNEADAKRAVFVNLTAPESLIEMARKEAARSHARGRDGQSPTRFARDLPSYVEKLSSELQAGEYRFIAYRQVLASKGAGKVPRVISVPSARDRAPLKAILRYLHRLVPESQPSLAQQVIRDLIAAIDTRSFKHFVRVDVEDFYPSISHDSAVAAIDRFVDLDEVRKILHSAISTPTLKHNATSRGARSTRGVPQGLSISNSVAELVMQDFDAKWKSRTDLAYFRYVDDILVLTRRRKHRLVFKEIKDDLNLLGLRCHELAVAGSKSTWGTLELPVDYLGYSVSAGSISVRDETVSRLKEKIAQRFLRYRRALSDRPIALSAEEWQASCEVRLRWYLDLTIAGCVLDEHRRGWIHYFALMNDFKLLRELDYFVVRKAATTVGLKPKSFVKAFRRAARSRSDRSGYVPNFDLYTSDQQRDVLRDIFLFPEEQILASSDEAVAEWFYRRLRREIDALETDLAIAY